jgi:hypothetical protein
MRPEEWIVNGEVGISSQTLWSYFMGVREAKNRNSFGIPHDTDDWQRCYKLLKLFPEWRARIAEVGQWDGRWKPLVDKWPELENLWESSTLDDAWKSTRKLTATERKVSDTMYRIIKQCERDGILELERRGIVRIDHMSESGWSLTYL